MGGALASAALPLARPTSVPVQVVADERSGLLVCARGGPMQPCDAALVRRLARLSLHLVVPLGLSSSAVSLLHTTAMDGSRRR